MVSESGELPTFLRARAYCLLSKVDLVERQKNLLEAYVDGVRTRDHSWKAKTTSRVNCRVRLSSLGLTALETEKRQGGCQPKNPAKEPH